MDEGTPVRDGGFGGRGNACRGIPSAAKSTIPDRLCSSSQKYNSCPGRATRWEQRIELNLRFLMLHQTFNKREDIIPFHPNSRQNVYHSPPRLEAPSCRKSQSAKRFGNQTPLCPVPGTLCTLGFAAATSPPALTPSYPPCLRGC